jgi:hypothetical protein
MVNEKATAMEELYGCLMHALRRKDGCLSRVTNTDGCDRRPPGRLAAELPHQKLGIKSELVGNAARMAPNKLGLPVASTVTRALVGAAAADAAASQIVGTQEAGNCC